jgi:deoxyribonuclease V
MTKISELCVISHGKYNGYCLFTHGENLDFRVYDIDFEIENIVVDHKGNVKSKRSILSELTSIDMQLLLKNYEEEYAWVKKLDEQTRWSDLIDIVDYHIPNGFERTRIHLAVWLFERIKKMDSGLYKNDEDILQYYLMQNELKQRVVVANELSKEPQFVAGVDVAYNDLEKRMVGAIVILNAVTLEVVEKVYHEMEITFPYIPGLFSFREIPPLIEAYKKLRLKPDLIVCDGHGIAHPKGVGMATHLGIELDVPTIGCAKSRLIGSFEKEALGTERGSRESLIWENKEVGVALRTQTGINPLFVSVGHKIDLETAVNWVLKLCPHYRLPETTRVADQFVNTLMKERTEYDLHNDNEESDQLA